jgi:hypothetical protein
LLFLLVKEHGCVRLLLLLLLDDDDYYYMTEGKGSSSTHTLTQHTNKAPA